MQTVGSVLAPYPLIDKLKEQKLLQTTAAGVFYTYREVLEVNKNPSNMLKQFYIYARTTGLLKAGEVLQIRDTDTSALFATILADTVTLHASEQPKAED